MTQTNWRDIARRLDREGWGSLNGNPAELCGQERAFRGALLIELHRQHTALGRIADTLEMLADPAALEDFREERAALRNLEKRAQSYHARRRRAVWCVREWKERHGLRPWPPILKGTPAARINNWAERRFMDEDNPAEPEKLQLPTVEEVGGAEKTRDRYRRWLDGAK